MKPAHVTDRFAPTLLSRIFYVAGGLAAIGSVFRGANWLDRLTDVFSILVFPLDGAGLGLAAFLLILGFALSRRKRLAWWIALGFLSLLWLAPLALFVALLVEVFQGRPTDPLQDSALSSYLFNGVSIGFLVTVLLVRRQDFAAHTARGNVRRAAMVFLGGAALATAVCIPLFWMVDGSVRPRSRLSLLLRRLVTGEDTHGPVGQTWVSSLLGILIAISGFVALTVLLRSQRHEAQMTLDDEVRVRQLLQQNSEDSLGYFATRRDKSVCFAPERQSAIAHRVETGVCLAAGDPLGPVSQWPAAIDSWVTMARTYGWTPAVIGASEAGARVYREAGFRVTRVGDEAILNTNSFDLHSRELRNVRQAVERLRRQGYTVRVRRHRDIPRAELEHLIELADAWRHGPVERGFSMALGRLGDDLDGNCLMVEAVFGENSVWAGEPAGLLSFVPWGPDGASLDVMRRSPNADNGVTELMVSGLMAQGGDVGIRRVSLNFAVFRSAFEEGEALGATAARRLKRRLLTVASRWFQIEQLYRSNVKYAPTWQPRFVCTEDGGDLGAVGLATGIAEGQLDLPGWLSPRPPAPQPIIRLADHPELAELLAEPEPVIGERQAPEQVRHRMATRASLLQAGIQPYPVDFAPDHHCKDVVLSNRERAMAIAGRVLAIRDFGGVLFLQVQDWTGQAQLLLEASALGAERVAELAKVLSLGDHVGAHGVVGRSRNGTTSLVVDRLELTAKALRPLPDKHRGISDPETKVRQRYLDLIMNADARHQLQARSLALRAVRETLQDHGYLEVETPILQTVHGGANARPFRTHINAYDLDLYLRIAPELFLKRLMVGGLDRVFEIGRNFRNEGADATHNPEFTMLEAYQAYADYTVMRHVAQEIIVRAAQAANGTTVVRGTDHLGVEHEVDLAGEWRVVTVNEALSEATGETITADTTKDELVAIADRLDISIAPSWGRGDVLLELYEHLVEDRTVAPTFYCDFPAEVSPLTREHRDDPRLAERWDLVAFGAEIGTAYSELVDPVVQRDRLTAQSLLAAKGNPEAMELDESFLTALEYAMPPTGGLGMGMDRLVMMLTNTSIRETIAFPLVRPRERS